MWWGFDLRVTEHLCRSLLAASGCVPPGRLLGCSERFSQGGFPFGCFHSPFLSPWRTAGWEAATLAICCRREEDSRPFSILLGVLFANL